MSHGISSRFCEDCFEVSATTACVSLLEFCHVVIDNHGNEYLRSPTENDLKHVERSFHRVGFPGCIGALDCAGWL